MKILSKFQDYYDGCQAYTTDIDPKLVWSRETREEVIDWNINHNHKNRDFIDATEKIRDIYDQAPPAHRILTKGVISFCGKAYVFYKFQEKCHYSFNSLYKELKEISTSKTPWADQANTALKTIKGKKIKGRPNWNVFYRPPTKEVWNNFLDKCNFNIPDETHLYFNSPVIVYYKREILDKVFIINPKLKSFDFASQVDPFTAYQELSMYIGNNLVTQMDPEVHVSDKIKAESRGFDKWSFRTHPSESKKPRKNKK